MIDRSGQSRQFQSVKVNRSPPGSIDLSTLLGGWKSVNRPWKSPDNLLLPPKLIDPSTLLGGWKVIDQSEQSQQFSHRQSVTSTRINRPPNTPTGGWKVIDQSG